MKSIISLVMVVSVLVVLSAVEVSGAPKPSGVSTTWQLEIKLDKLTPISVRAAGDDEAKTYWFVHYELINRTGREQFFVPNIELYTNTGQVIRAGRGVPTKVFLSIKKLLNDPLLRNQTDITGKILQGRDNARRGIAIFKDFDSQAGNVDIFIAGLSGELAIVKLPIPVNVKRINDEGKKVDVRVNSITLTKTLHASYTISGDLLNRKDLSAKQKNKLNWIMR